MEDEMGTCDSNVYVIGIDLRGARYFVDSARLERWLTESCCICD
jgi:hypothetical protein